MTPSSPIQEWADLCSGLALLYIGPDGQPSEYTKRVYLAIETEDEEELDHVGAILLTLLGPRHRNEPWMYDKWSALSHDFHANRCKWCRSKTPKELP